MATSQVNTGECLEFEYCGRLGDKKQDYIQMTFHQSKSLGTEYIHACHGMIFARTNRVVWEQLSVRACILMQMRFDGVIGFPGGLVDSGEDLVTALNREMEEEIGLEVSKYSFTADDHVETMVNQVKKLVLHFFVKEITEEEFCLVEQRQLSAPEFGVETMGCIRVPLYTMPDGLRGFPAFLANQFIGNARHQLLTGLSHCKIMTQEEIQSSLAKCHQHLARTAQSGCKV
ncbi:U8 snoRNA-decapping enzyme-like [Babylonia areolata]|uniref:U8 snoRNA-decapping enzyme-like n=1 Tax=Babylonia areolata TaxID=304850 RepID=UPI003FD0A5E1